ncbi:cytochrome-c peroxidase [Dinoroseobacter sp. S124A]|uniref:cytochrome-c peroxidase n=1 Tax=Dinoroseobacter sp. S124A TaxID=3415128 RepID=UPI003C7DD946
MLFRLMFLPLLCAAAPLAAETEAVPTTLEELGEQLFFDVNFSANRSQACATCHVPDYAFADPRGMASLGDDGQSLGDRNAPTLTYAALTPEFHRDRENAYRGGQFWDGRASELADQAVGPPLNPIEMGLSDAAAVVARIAENPGYKQAFAALFAPDTLSDPARGFRAFAEALAAFERTEALSPFDSKYDRFLRGEVALSKEEELGRLLFFSEQFTNCNQCHQLSRSAIDPRETFTDYRYHNIGVPENGALRAQNGVTPGHIDPGLSANPAVDDPMARGKFRTPSLRNVAVTGPYMHNGVFAELRTVVKFYNRYNSRAETAQINPETDAPYGKMPVPETLAHEELTHGPALDDRRIDALVAFLRTLTDQRYEHLLE